MPAPTTGGEFLPSNHGLVAWSYDPTLAVNSSAVTNGTVYLTKVIPASSMSVTKIYWHVAVTGATATASQNFVGLYSAAGALLASGSADVDAVSTGLKVTTIASTAVASGASYWVGMVFNATTPPSLVRTTGLAAFGALVNAGLTAATYRFATNGTAQTSLPASITPSANAQGIPFWAAIG